MHTTIRQSSRTGSWRDVYQTAILEPDLNKLPERIVEAEAALAVRARELFYTIAEDAEEEEALDDAMCILQVLRSSLRHRGTIVAQGTNDRNCLKRTRVSHCFDHMTTYVAESEGD
jgi:hypothetical protein